MPSLRKLLPSERELEALRSLTSLVRRVASGASSGDVVADEDAELVEVVVVSLAVVCIVGARVRKEERGLLRRGFSGW